MEHIDVNPSLAGPRHQYGVHYAVVRVVHHSEPTNVVALGHIIRSARRRTDRGTADLDRSALWGRGGATLPMAGGVVGARAHPGRLPSAHRVLTNERLPRSQWLEIGSAVGVRRRQIRRAPGGEPLHGAKIQDPPRTSMAGYARPLLCRAGRTGTASSGHGPGLLCLPPTI